MYVRPTPDNSFDKYDEERLHMEQLMSTPLIDFGVPMRIAIPLDDAGITRLRDIVGRSRADLMKINRIGEKAINEVERILNRFDLSIDMKI